MNKLTLILGGARSGKSRYAQDLASRQSSGGRVVYIATAQAGDDEMCARITKHRYDRPAEWVTVEEPLEVGNALMFHTGADAVIIDCLTFFVTNHLLNGSPETCGDSGWDVGRAESGVAALIASAQANRSPIIIVSNEVGLGLVPDTPLGRVFRDVAGRANQDVAAAADCVILMVAGIPMFIKGGPA